MNDREALKLALEALEYPLNQSHENFNVDMAELISHRAITALRQAIAEAEQKQPFCYHDGRDIVGKEFADHSDVFPLYTSPPPRQPLTDEEIWDLIEQKELGSAYAIARAIEAAHGIKGESK